MVVDCLYLCLLIVFMILKTLFHEKTPSTKKHKLGKSKIQWHHYIVMIATPMSMKHRSEQSFIFI